MNVRIIDPGRSSASKPRQWGMEALFDNTEELEVFEDLPELQRLPEADDRFELLLELRGRQLEFLRGCLSGEGADRLSGGARACFAARIESLHASVQELLRTGEDLGLEVPPSPAGPPESVLQALPAAAGGPFSSGPEMIGAALFLNCLSVRLVEAFLCEGDAAAWRAALLPALVDDCRFEGRLKGYLEEAGERAEALGKERIALAAGLQAANPQRLWSFDLLRMGIRRLLGEGQAVAAGGSFAAE